VPQSRSNGGQHDAMTGRWTDEEWNAAWSAFKREIKQRDCPHERTLDVTRMGDPMGTYLCADCGKPGIRDTAKYWADVDRYLGVTLTTNSTGPR